jgi:hypothetical protein
VQKIPEQFSSPLAESPTELDTKLSLGHGRLVIYVNYLPFQVLWKPVMRRTHIPIMYLCWGAHVHAMWEDATEMWVFSSAQLPLVDWRYSGNQRQSSPVQRRYM